MTGQIEIDVFADGFVRFRWGWAAACWPRRNSTASPPRLSVVARPTSRLVRKKPSTAALASFAADADARCLVLHVSGKGRHRLDLAVRLKLSRQGGWRVAEGVLPAAPAAALEILVPKPQTELRLGQVADRRS